MLFCLSSVSLATELTIALIPEMNVFEQMQRYKPMGDYIKEKTGIVIKFKILSRYGNIIEKFKEDNFDGAFWGSFTGAMAQKKMDVDFIARPVWNDGTSTYHGYILVRRDSGIKNVEDMRGKIIAFVDKATTAGYVFPLAYFSDQGIDDFKTFIKEYYFTGSHDAAIDAVLDKKADIAAAKNTIYEKMVGEDVRVKEELMIIARSHVVPSNGLGMRHGLDESIKNRLKETLLNMHKYDDGKVVLKKFRARRFIETTSDDYIPVFDLAESAGIDLKMYKYFNK
jgi:phosphonate transport system substrate-binding protein